MKNLFLFFLITCFTSSGFAQKKEYISPDGVKYRLSFKDEFNDEHLDKKKWNYMRSYRVYQVGALSSAA